ncbi:hypothetical protein HPB52_011511 [Rhipicephalus sanguineus]|uniref:Uncharacterized protein n=1 Tax=Rhipicephalus sanguineus TaxID=34632 RepID=A0A9D4QAD0_RHISA|nr:hypothetical protein HPB52_011511 [Rhipicephalus sanguineus]
MLASTKHRSSHSPMRLSQPEGRRVCFADTSTEESTEETSQSSSRAFSELHFEDFRMNLPAARPTSASAGYWDRYSSPPQCRPDFMSVASSTTLPLEGAPSTPAGLFPEEPAIPSSLLLLRPRLQATRSSLEASWPNAFERDSSSGTFQPAPPPDDRGASALSWLPSIVIGVLVAAMLTVALTLALTMDLQDADVGDWPASPVQSFMGNIGSGRAAIPPGPVFKPQGRRPGAKFRPISEAHNVTRQSRTVGRAQRRDRALGVQGPRLPSLGVSNRTLSHRCGRHMYTYCQEGRSEVYYSASLRTCTSTEADSVHVCNHGVNRFTSLDSCHISCVHASSGRPQDRCYEAALFTTCSWQDVAETWWYYDGAVCTQWSLPLGNCPLQVERVFRSRRVCDDTCILRREGEYSGEQQRCDAPDAATCTPRQLKYPYFASMRANGAARCISASSPELKAHRCLVGTNRFESVASCERACADM